MKELTWHSVYGLNLPMRRGLHGHMIYMIRYKSLTHDLAAILTTPHRRACLMDNLLDRRSQHQSAKRQFATTPQQENWATCKYAYSYQA
jgi:hypothetical protein